MGKKSSRKNQKVYRMKGCSKKTRKNYSGGSPNSNLAYTGTNIPTSPNPFLAYTGRGGALTHSLEMPINTDGLNKTLPNTGPIDMGMPATPFLNSQIQRGGCGCGLPIMSGGGNKGGCGPLCNAGFMVGGNHRIGCKCSSCKNIGKQYGGNQGIPYPNGLVGSPWIPSTEGWPGIDGVQGGRNFIAPNNYKTDVQTAMISTGAQPPFSIGGKRTKKQKGGSLDNFLGQDLINLGRQFNFGLGSAYNALAGYASPVNPLPWKGQLPNSPSLSTIRAASK